MRPPESDDTTRVEQLLDDYSRRFAQDFFATAPIQDRPTS